MGDFMKGDGTGQLVVRGTVARDVVIRLSNRTGGSMMSDDEVLTLARSAAREVLQFGTACELGVHSKVISDELQSTAKSGKSRSLCAYELCRKAPEMYLQGSGI
jgi:hypothetical protein